MGENLLNGRVVLGVAVGGGDQDEVCSVEREDPRRLGKVNVEADEEPDADPRLHLAHASKQGTRTGREVRT